MRRSFLFLAAGLLASLAFATPSQAGSILAETDVAILLPANASSTDVEITYSSPPIGPIVILSASTVNVTSTSIVGDLAIINYTSIAGNQTLDYTFTTNDPNISITKTQLTGITGLQHGQNAGLMASLTLTSSVPEPTSMALLGIGMAGFFTYRRLFKRAAIV